MASASAVSSNVSLRVLFDGSRTYRAYEIASVDLFFDGVDVAISARLGEGNLAGRVMPINVEGGRATGSIGMTSTCAKTLRIEARAFQSYENPMSRTRHADGTVTCETRLRRNDFDVRIAEKPEFEAGKTYKIVVVNGGAELIASIQEDETVRRPVAAPTYATFEQEMIDCLGCSTDAEFEALGEAELVSRLQADSTQATSERVLKKCTLAELQAILIEAQKNTETILGAVIASLIEAMIPSKTMIDRLAQFSGKPG